MSFIFKPFIVFCYVLLVALMVLCPKTAKAVDGVLVSDELHVLSLKPFVRWYGKSELDFALQNIGKTDLALDLVITQPDILARILVPQNPPILRLTGSDDGEMGAHISDPYRISILLEAGASRRFTLQNVPSYKVNLFLWNGIERNQFVARVSLFQKLLCGFVVLVMLAAFLSAILKRHFYQMLFISFGLPLLAILFLRLGFFSLRDDIFLGYLCVMGFLFVLLHLFRKPILGAGRKYWHHCLFCFDVCLIFSLLGFLVQFFVHDFLGPATAQILELGLAGAAISFAFGVICFNPLSLSWFPILLSKWLRRS